MKITITDRFLYSYIDSFTRNDKPVFASNKHLAEQIQKSESVISHSISRLLKLGYLVNKGNKYIRQLYTNKHLVNADFNQSKVNNNQTTAENSITYEEIRRVIAENSKCEKLKTAIANAENSNILIKILISYTKNIYIDKKSKEDKYRPDDIDNQIWEDFKTIRKSKKAKITETAMKGIQKQASIAGLHIEEALKIMVENNWQGFKAEWLNNKQGGKNGKESAKQKLMRERDELLASFGE